MQPESQALSTLLFDCYAPPADFRDIQIPQLLVIPHFAAQTLRYPCVDFIFFINYCKSIRAAKSFINQGGRFA
jgi:hypothetical protein